MSEEFSRKMKALQKYLYWRVRCLSYLSSKDDAKRKAYEDVISYVEVHFGDYLKDEEEKK